MTTPKPMRPRTIAASTESTGPCGLDRTSRSIAAVATLLSSSGFGRSGRFSGSGREAALVASPGSYDHKHVARIAGVEHCLAYGPGRLELAHQPDEYVEVSDLLASIRVMALAILDLLGAEAR